MASLPAQHPKEGVRNEIARNSIKLPDGRRGRFIPRYLRAAEILRDSLSHLFNYLETELTTKVMRDTDLISRCLSGQILSAADKDSVSLNEIWSAMWESALLDEYLLFTEFRLSRDSSFSVAMMRYIREQNDSANKETIFAMIGSECRWDELAVGISNDKLRRNVQWLVDWIEADIAYAAFVCSRMNRKIFSGNRKHATPGR